MVNPTNIDHIVVIDNVSMAKLLNSIIDNYPILLDKCYHNIENLTIITTTQILPTTKDSIYTNFNKIHKIPINHLDYYKFFKSVQNIINPNNLTYVVLFANNIDPTIYPLFNTSTKNNNLKITLIGANDIHNLPNLTIHNILDNIPQTSPKKAITHLISKGSFLPHSTANTTDIINIINNNILITYEKYIQLENDIINIIKTPSSTEIYHKAINHYGKMDQILNNTKNSLLKNFLPTNENTKLFLTYSIQSDINMTKKSHKRIILKRMIENIPLLTRLNTPLSTSSPPTTENSTNFFTSPLTFTDWIEEVKNNQSMGLLFSLTTNNLIKLGFADNIIVNNISSTIIPVPEFIQYKINHFNDTSKHITFGNTNKINIIRDRIIGNGNTLLPLYINKYHWKISKLYVKPLLGIAASHNPLGYHKNHLKIMFTILIKMTIKCFSPNYINNKTCRYYITFLRTCTQISFDNNYSRSLKKYIKQHPITHNVLGQALSTGYTLKQYDHQTTPAFTKMTTLMNIIYTKTNGFNKYIKLLENNYGYLPDDLTTVMVNYIKNNVTTT